LQGLSTKNMQADDILFLDRKKAGRLVERARKFCVRRLRANQSWLKAKGLVDV
jgi:hypothetical protein